jgi:collagenase-like PrtC family protease
MTRLVEFSEPYVTVTKVSRMERAEEIVRLAQSCTSFPIRHSTFGSPLPKHPGRCTEMSSATLQRWDSTSSLTRCHTKFRSPSGAALDVTRRCPKTVADPLRYR